MGNGAPSATIPIRVVDSEGLYADIPGGVQVTVASVGGTQWSDLTPSGATWTIGSVGSLDLSTYHPTLYEQLVIDATSPTTQAQLAAAGITLNDTTDTFNYDGTNAPGTYVVVVDARPEQTSFNPPYPRIATHWLGGNQPYYQPSVQQQLARGSIVLIGIYPGWEQGYGTSFESVLQGIHSYNPNAKIYNYILNEAWNGNEAFAELADKADAMTWWLYPSGTSGTPVPSFFGPPFVTLNNMLFTPEDTGGKNFIEWFVDWCISQYDRPSLAGFYTDNVFWKPRVDGDWNRDGTSDANGSPTVWSWQRQGFMRHFEYLRSQLSGKTQGGNAGDWMQLEAVLTGYEGMMDFGLLEAIIGEGWSLEYWYPWSTVLEQYRKVLGYLTNFKGAIFHQTGSVTDYQAMRYGLATCLLDNGWYCFNSSTAYGDAPYFDEYSHNLGYPTQTPPSSAYSLGVWLREFDNGCAIVNPKDNGTRTITLPSAGSGKRWDRLSGTQDPSVNNGEQNVLQVTINARDGLILKRVSTV